MYALVEIDIGLLKCVLLKTFISTKVTISISLHFSKPFA